MCPVISVITDFSRRHDSHALAYNPPFHRSPITTTMVIIDEKDSQLTQDHNHHRHQQAIPDTAPPPYPGLPLDNNTGIQVNDQLELELANSGTGAGSSNLNAYGHGTDVPPPFSITSQSPPPARRVAQVQPRTAPGPVPLAETPAAIPEPRAPASLKTLPPHILLYIIHHTLPDKDKINHSLAARTKASVLERSRKVLYWILICLRCVNRAFYVGECYM